MHSVLRSSALNRPSGTAIGTAPRRSLTLTAPTPIRLAALKDNMSRLSAEFPAETMSKVIVRDASGAEVVTIPNMEGKRASLVFYAAAAAKFGAKLDEQAAAWLLEQYDEVVADARAHRGSHPNIDLPLDVKSGAVQGPLRIEVVKA